MRFRILIFFFWILAGLKKVTSEMQTHKNPGLRSGPAPFKAPGGAGASPGNVKSVAATQDKPPVFERDGKKWIIVSGGWGMVDDTYMQCRAFDKMSL